MLRNRLYYAIKPLLPWSLRMAVRRWFAVRKRERVRDVWPIVPGSEHPPAGWSGWPDGKQFAFILTHDIEGSVGLQKVKHLAEIEMSFGFRSSFNFIPDGTYEVPSELRHWLVNNGFEVGVHDLKHDGHLFSSRRVFDRAAPRINCHLQEWGAVGFRSGFMLRNLEWLHQLNLQYDSSTFDTDPFEPQPQGHGTIFPFWVPNPDFNPNPNPASGLTHHASAPPSSIINSPSSIGMPRPGYVELPYTLPQDSTLFFLLGEQTPEIWTKKMDWIAGHGGMALVTVHPDYVQFAGESPTDRTFPVEHYVQFLKYAQSSYSGLFWQALPREVAAFWKQNMPNPQVAEEHDQKLSSK